MLRLQPKPGNAALRRYAGPESASISSSPATPSDRLPYPESGHKVPSHSFGFPNRFGVRHRRGDAVWARLRERMRDRIWDRNWEQMRRRLLRLNGRQGPRRSAPRQPPFRWRRTPGGILVPDDRAVERRRRRGPSLDRQRACDAGASPYASCCAMAVIVISIRYSTCGSWDYMARAAVAISMLPPRADRLPERRLRHSPPATRLASGQSRLQRPRRPSRALRRRRGWRRRRGSWATPRERSKRD